jgi:hypothetical protein
MTEVFAKSPIGVLCSQFTQKLLAHPMASMFKKPVTNEQYLAKITHPMALETIKTKLKDNMYTSYKDWLNDLELMYNNAIEFNGLDSVTGQIAVYLKRKWDKMIERVSWFNHQNYEAKIRELYVEIVNLTNQLAPGHEIPPTPKYEVKHLCRILSRISDTSEIEKIIKQNGDQRVLKKSKDGLINLDHLSRKSLDRLWLQYGDQQSQL